MSWAILGFQVTILVTTVLAARYGQGPRRLVFWGWLLFTLFGSIFTYGLMLLQLATVFGSNWIAKKIYSASVSPQSAGRIDDTQEGAKTLHTPQDTRFVAVALPAHAKAAAEKEGDGLWIWAGAIICGGLFWLWISSFEPAQQASAITKPEPPTPVPAEAVTYTDADPERGSSKGLEESKKSSGMASQRSRMQQAAKPAQDYGQQKARVDARESTPVARNEADRLKHACAPNEVRKYNWRTNKNECT